MRSIINWSRIHECLPRSFQDASSVGDTASFAAEFKATVGSDPEPHFLHAMK